MTEPALSKHLAETITQRGTLTDGSLCFRTSKFTQVVTRLAPARVLVAGIGYNDGRCAPLITEELDRVIARDGKLTAFVDLSRQTGQASIGREWWAEWAKKNRPTLLGTHMLVKNRLMDMAISVLGMLVGGGIHTYSTTAAFEAAVAKEVPGFRNLPTYPDLPPMLP
jgi:hypothetical protein